MPDDIVQGVPTPIAVPASSPSPAPAIVPASSSQPASPAAPALPSYLPQQLASPTGAPASPGTSATDWAAIIANNAQRKATAATQNLAAASQVSPETAATAQRLAPVLGIPAAGIESDPNFWQQQFDLRSSRAALSADDKLTQWVATDLNNAKISQGDIPQLSQIGRLWNGVKQGWSQAGLQAQLGYLGATEGTTGLTPEQQDLGETLRQRLGELQQSQQQAPQGIAGEAGSFIGSTARMVGAAAPEAATGALVGGLMGLPEGGVGAVPGAIAGAARGLAMGIAGQQGVQAYGQTYDQLANSYDRFGKPIPEVTRQAASTLAGVGTAALATVGGETLTAPARALAGTLINKVALEAATRPTLARALGSFAASAVKSGVTGAVVNGGMTALQTIMPDLAKAVSSPDFQTVFNDPDQQDELARNIVDSMEQGAIAFPLAEMPMHGVALWADAARAHAADQNVQAWSALQDGAAASKTRTRNPDAFANLMALHAQDGGPETIAVPGDRIAELYQGLQTRPGAPEDPFAFVPDMRDQLSRALLTGGDVEIPTVEFTAHLAGTDIERALRPDIRLAPDAMTAREAEEFRNANLPPIDTEGLTAEDAGDAASPEGNTETPEQPEPDEADQIRQNIRDQLTRNGMTPDVAEQNAAVAASVFRTLSRRTGVSAADLFQRFGPQVQQNVQRFGPGNYGATDELIDSLRRGDAMPTDRQLYGDSLLEYLSKGENARGKNLAPLSAGGRRAATGGLVDEGGELAAMDAGQWHRAQRGRRNLVNSEGMRLEEAAQRAHAAGYFSDHAEAPDRNDLLEAIRSELGGAPRYRRPSAEATKREEFRTARGQLEQFLHERGIDIQKANNAEIKAALDEGNKEFNQTAYHGSPHIFDRFETSKIGSGEGAQIYGHGLYFAGNKDVASWYRNKLSKDDRVLLEHGTETRDLLHSDETGERLAANTLQEAAGDISKAKGALARVAELHRGNPVIAQARRVLDDHGDTLKFQPKGDGRLYHVEIPEEHEYLDWDKELNQQPQAIQEAVEKVWHQIPEDLREEYEDRLNTPFFSMTGREIYRILERAHTDDALPARPEEYKRSMRSDEFASATLKDNGVAGVKYLDGRSRGAGEGSRNFVVFDDARAHIQHYEQSQEPAVTLRGDELGSYADHKEMQARVREKLKEIRAAGPVHNPDLGEINFNRESVGKTLYRLSEDKAQLVPALRDILEKGRLVRSVPNHKGDANIKAFHTLETPVRLDGKDIFARTIIREDNRGNFYYDVKGEPASELFQAREDEGSSDRAKEQGRDSLDRGLSAAPAAEENIASQGDEFNLSLFQPEGGSGGARGSIQLGATRPIISLFRDADRSTFMHEMGHLFLHAVLDLSQRDEATDDIKTLAGDIQKWLKLKGGEYPTTDQHEQFARGFEQYLMTGKAPSAELRSAFQKFAAWLTRIYRDLTAFGAPISDQVRSIMDRLVATDEEIAEAKQAMGLNPLFRTPEEAGMTIDQFKRYTSLINRDQEEFYSKVLKRNMRGEAAKRRAEYKAEAEAVHPEIERQVKSRPALQAWYLLRYGRDILDPERDVMGGKVSTEAAKEILGAAYQRLPKGITAADGMHPDALAPAFGYDSGEAMLRDLVNENAGRQEAAASTGKSVSLQQWVNRLVNQALDDHLQGEFGTRLSDDSVEEAATEAADREGRRDVIAAELRALGKLAGNEKPPFSVQQVQKWARDSLAEAPIKQATNAGMYRRASAKAARDAERALLARKPLDAFKAKQRQMIADAFETEAQHISDSFDRTTKYWRSIAKNPTRSGTAQPFLDQVHGILDRLGMNVKRDPGELARALQSAPLDQFAASWAAHGYDLAVPSFLTDPRFSRHYADLTADQFEAARDAVTSLLRAGRLEQEVEIDGKREALSDTLDRIEDEAAELPNQAPVNKLMTPNAVQGAMRAATGTLREAHAAMRKVEDLLRLLGGHEGNTLLKTVFDPLKKADHAGNDLRVAAARSFKDFRDQLPAEWSKRLKDRVTTPELINRKTGLAETFTRDRLLMMALNVGNASNLDKLERGMQWAPGAAMQVLQRELTKNDWDLVQHVWDMFESYRPDIDAMQRRLTGVGMKFVEATPVETRFGTYRGGYFPVIYDPAEAPTQRLAENLEQPFSGPDYYRVTTSTGHTVSRTNYAAPLDLNWDALPVKLGQVIHECRFRRSRPAIPI